MDNKEYYLRVKQCLRKQIWRKSPDLLKENSWIFHHDNAPLQKLSLWKHSTNTIEQSLYSQDMVPAEFLIFLQLKLPQMNLKFFISN